MSLLPTISHSRFGGIIIKSREQGYCANVAGLSWLGEKGSDGGLKRTQDKNTTNPVGAGVYEKLI